MFLHHKNIRFYDFSIKATKKIVAFKGTEKNGVTQQAEFIGDSYSSKTTPFKYARIHIIFYNIFGECAVQVRNQYELLYRRERTFPAIYELLILLLTLFGECFVQMRN